MKLQDLAETSKRVAETSGRLAKVELLAGCLGRLESQETEVAVAFLAGELPAGRIGVGTSMVYAARDVAPADSPSLTVTEVAETLERIKGVSGRGSGAERKRLLEGMMGRATRDEQSFLARLLVGELRQGALEGLMADALARAARVPAGAVRRALMITADKGRVARAALAEGEAGLAEFGIRLFQPVQPMLASPAEDLADALGRLGRAALEFKLDGARVQVHRAGEDVRVFTRRLNDVSAAVPEIVEAVLALPVREIILDGEALALGSGGRPLPFQTTMKRFGRKLDVERMRQELPLRSFFFDCLYLDGRSLIDLTAAERFAALAESLEPALLVPRTETDDRERAGAFLREALEQGHEGLMAKSLEAVYAAGSRGKEWLKLKQAHTLDLVVLAAEWGSGRRKGWLSNLHLGARDPSSGGFVMLGKTFKGMTDKVLAWQTEELLKRELSRDSHTVFVRPELVVEVAFNDVQSSPHYPGGVALRFARIKCYRPDKRAADADVLDTVRALLPAP